MQSYRIIVPRACRSAAPARNMATCFPHFTSSPVAEFGPLFKLLETPPFFPASTLRRSHPSSRHGINQQFFGPRFDVREVSAAFELQGELPGIKHEDVTIEFINPNTLVIRGKTESVHTEKHGEENIAKENGNTEAAESPTTLAADNDAATKTSASSYQKATVEDEDYVDAGAEREQGQGETATATNNTVSEKPTEAAKTDEQNQPRYWVSERATGEFERRFRFPSEVDQEAVKASLKNGILSIVVPKVARKERRILVE